MGIFNTSFGMILPWLVIFNEKKMVRKERVEEIVFFDENSAVTLLRKNIEKCMATRLDGFCVVVNFSSFITC